MLCRGQEHVANTLLIRTQLDVFHLELADVRIALSDLRQEVLYLAAKGGDVLGLDARRRRLGGRSVLGRLRGGREKILGFVGRRCRHGRRGRWRLRSGRLCDLLRSLVARLMRGI